MHDIDPNDWDAVVIAAGAWSGALQVKGVQLPESVPVKGHLIGFDMRPGLLGPYVREGSAYVLQRADGFVIAGSSEERVGFDPSVDEQVCEALHRNAAKLLPALEGAHPSRKWIGFRPWTAGGPHIGRVQGTNVWLAYGHYRNGILLTPVTADRIATSVLRGV
jgi:glycine oxidase